MPEIDKETLFKATSKFDAWLRLFGTLDAEEIRKAIDGITNLYVIAESEFQRRFPEEFRTYLHEQNDE